MNEENIPRYKIDEIVIQTNKLRAVKLKRILDHERATEILKDLAAIETCDYILELIQKKLE